MAFKWHYRTISSYRVLPPRIRVIEQPELPKDPVERYLRDVEVFRVR